MGREKKIEYLDGLRGFFCLVVLIQHYMMVFFPSIRIMLFNDGNLAVMYFLFLSGFVMYLSVLKKQPSVQCFRDFFEKVMNFMARRYFRLLPIILVAIMTSYLIYIGGGYFIGEIVSKYNYTTLTKYVLNDGIGIGKSIFDGFFGAFFYRPLLDTPLWTIHYEFWGIVLLYALSIIIYNKPYKIWIYTGLAFITFIVFHDVNVLAMIMGVIISDLYFAIEKSEKKIWIIVDKIIHKKINLFFYIIVLIVIYGISMFGVYPSYCRLLFIVLLFIMLEQNQGNAVTKLLENKWIITFSEYSFAIYAFHWIIICSFSSWFVTNCSSTMGYIGATVIGFILTVLITLFYSVLISSMVDYKKRKLTPKRH